MCHFVKSTLQGLFGELLKGFICLDLYNTQSLASPFSCPSLHLVNEAVVKLSFLDGEFVYALCFVYTTVSWASWPLHAKASAFLCCFLRTFKRHWRITGIPCLASPHSPTPGHLSTGSFDFNSHYYYTRVLIFWKRQTNPEMNKQADSA